MSSSYEKAVRPLIRKLYSSNTEKELVENFEELKALLTSMIESEEIEGGDTVITALYTLIEISKIQSVSIARLESQIEELQKR